MKTKKILIEVVTACAFIMIGVSIAGIVWAAIIIASDNHNQEIKKCRETPISDLQDDNVYMKCMKMLRN